MSPPHPCRMCGTLVRQAQRKYCPPCARRVKTAQQRRYRGAVVRVLVCHGCGVPLESWGGSGRHRAYCEPCARERIRSRMRNAARDRARQELPHRAVADTMGAARDAHRRRLAELSLQRGRCDRRCPACGRKYHLTGLATPCPQCGNRLPVAPTL